MDKKYNYQEFKKDPRTTMSRCVVALFGCVDSNKKNPESILLAIDKAYSVGKHRSPSYIKDQKKKALKLLNQFVF